MAALALPVIPTLSCPTSAAALSGAGLAPVCHAAGSLTGVISSAASQVVGFSVDSVLDGIASWVSSGAVWLLGQVGSFLSSTTSVDLGAAWFTGHYRTMAGLAGVMVLPLLLAGVIQAIHRQSGTMLARSVLINVPLALLLTAVAVQLVQLGLSLTDAMSSAVAQGTGVDSGHLFDSVIKALGSPAGAAASAVASPASPPTFIVLLGGLAVVVGAFLLWVELLVRAAAVYVAVLFLPLALASLAWPAIAHWCRRLVDTLVALVLGKFVIVAVLSLGVSAMASGAGGSAGGGTNFTWVLAGAAMLALAAASPWALFRLLPFVEAGAVGHLEGVGRRTYQSAAGPTRSLAHTAMRVATAGGTGGGSEAAIALGAAGGGAVSGTGSGGAGPSGPSGGAGGAGGAEEDPVPRVRKPDLGRSPYGGTGIGAVSAPGSSIPGHPSDMAAAAKLVAHLRTLYDDPDDMPPLPGFGLPLRSSDGPPPPSAGPRDSDGA